MFRKFKFGVYFSLP